MRTDIYYFTGTGNSLSIAKKLAGKTGNAALTSIPKTVDKKTIEAQETVGIVCPVYMYNLPHIVVDFIKKLQRPEYLFIVLAGGGEPGGCIKAARQLCAAQQLPLSAVFNLTMPSNYTPYGADPEETQKTYFAAAEKEVEHIVRIVSGGQEHFDKNTAGFFRTFIHPGLLYKLGYRFINTMDRDFSVDDTCNSCGICEQVCPAGNISLSGGRPEWHSRCEQCYACLQWCPQEAIQYRDKTAGVPRYRNPHITLKEIVQASARV